jgi:drug/metabolite transporter (DMT)-like permease
MLSGILILPFCRNLRTNFNLLIKNFKGVFTISLFQTALLYIFFYQGIDKTPAAVGAIVVGAGPLFIALLAHFTTGRDPLTKRKVVAMLIGFSGIILLALAKDKNIENQAAVLLGILLLVIGNLAGGYGNILVSKDRFGIAPVFLNAVQIFMGGVMILIVSFFFEEVSFLAKPTPYYFALGWLGFLSAAAFSLWFVVLSRPEIKVSEINVWKFIIPLLGAVLSWLLIANEGPQWNTLAGMLLIALAIVIIYGKRKN